jgi:hypothetical protein
MEKLNLARIDQKPGTRDRRKLWDSLVIGEHINVTAVDLQKEIKEPEMSRWIVQGKRRKTWIIDHPDGQFLGTKSNSSSWVMRCKKASEGK